MKKLKVRTPGLFVILSSVALAGAQGHDEAIRDLLLALVILLPVAKLAGMLAEKLAQPAVMGELLAGLILGNLTLLGFDGLISLKTDAGLEILAQLGVILLLFEIGLDASLADLMKVGVSSLLVAAVGVILPFVLGWSVSAWLLADRSYYVHTFIGATLCATSVGITARVLQDIDAIRTQEAKIILGASVIDDVLGLLILAVVSGMIMGADRGAPVTVGSISYLIGTAVIFLAGSLYLGIWLVPHMFRHAAKAASRGVGFTLSLSLCFLLSYLSAVIGLAPIVGAFAAGLILESVPMEKYLQEKELPPNEMLHPLSTFLVPLFFIQMGLKIDLASLFRIDVLGLAAGLTAAAIVGKQACGLGAIGKNLNRISIGIGMIPRGEVGLIFAGIGLSLAVKGERILDDATFSAILIMVMVTTIVTPPLLQWSFSHRGK
ncbi:MAG TPA: cation:proton antiporter [Verrucomicrobiae bacterium]|nr:cation:proton antiporter [Verrucomicrobiae bacterium]